MNTSSEMMLHLLTKADQVNLNSIGWISVSTPNGISGKMLGRFIRIVTAQALMDNVANVEGGLLVRDAYCDTDLADAGEDLIISRDWRQPPVVRQAELPLYKDTQANTTIPIYTTGRRTNNDHKVMLIYAVEHVGPETKGVFTNNVTFKRGNVVSVTWVDITSIKNRKIIFLPHPVLYKRGDDANILFSLKNEAAGQFDNLKIHGIIGEGLGHTYCGGNYEF